VNDAILSFNCVKYSGANGRNLLYVLTHKWTTKYFSIMKYFLNVISIALVVIWVLVYWSNNTFQTIDMLLIMSGVILLVRVLFNKHLSGKRDRFNDKKISGSF
jgi:hypothetical protein